MSKTISIVLSQEDIDLIKEIKTHEANLFYYPSTSDIIRGCLRWYYNELYESDNLDTN